MSAIDLTEAVDHAVAAVLRDPRSVPGLSGAPGELGSTRSDSPGSNRTGGRDPNRTGDPAATLAADPDRARATDPAEALRLAGERAARWPGILTDRIDAAPAPARPGPLAGVPVAVKDNIDVAGLVTGMGGPTGRRHPTKDAAAVALLQDAGATIVGHAEMRELAWGVTTPGCPNPWRAGLETGGSSGGSTAAVAAGIAAFALGTDTGGSIRIPAALCGVTGLRPTHGAAPMDGIVAMTPGLDTVGPLARSAADCLLVHEILSGPGHPAPDDVSGLTVGLLTGWAGRVDAAVQRAVDDAADALRAAGVRIVSVDLGSAGLASCVAYVLMLIASSRRHLADAERHGDAVDGEVLEQLRQGARIDADPALYPRAQALAAALRRDVMAAMDAQDLAAVLGPVTAVHAVPSGADAVEIAGRQVPVADALSRYTALASVTGLPALSLPAGLRDGLPVGVQLMGRAFGERTLALVAGPIERGPGATPAVALRRLPS